MENRILGFPENDDDDANIHNTELISELLAEHKAIVVFAECNVAIKADGDKSENNTQSVQPVRQKKRLRRAIFD